MYCFLRVTGKIVLQQRPIKPTALELTNGLHLEKTNDHKWRITFRVSFVTHFVQNRVYILSDICVA